MEPGWWPPGELRGSAHEGRTWKRRRTQAARWRAARGDAGREGSPGAAGGRRCRNPPRGRDEQTRPNPRLLPFRPLPTAGSTHPGERHQCRPPAGRELTPRAPSRPGPHASSPNRERRSALNMTLKFHINRIMFAPFLVHCIQTLYFAHCVQSNICKAFPSCTRRSDTFPLGRVTQGAAEAASAWVSLVGWESGCEIS